VAGIEHLTAVLRSGRLTQTKLADQTGVLLDIESLQVLTLNETGMFLVERLCAGVSTTEALARAMAAEFEVEEDVAREDVAAFLAELEGFLPT